MTVNVFRDQRFCEFRVDKSRPIGIHLSSLFGCQFDHVAISLNTPIPSASAASSPHHTASENIDLHALGARLASAHRADPTAS